MLCHLSHTLTGRHQRGSYYTKLRKIHFRNYTKNPANAKANVNQPSLEQNEYLTSVLTRTDVQNTVHCENWCN